jgi:hypothetical protein
MADIPPSLKLPPPPSEKEAALYYAGLPSKPVLVARTGAPWKEPTGPEAYYQLKELCGTNGYHAIEQIWEYGLASKVRCLLDSMKVKWTSLEIVGFANVEDFSGPPPTLWIGVHSASLSGTDGVVTAYKCRDLLVENGITDVDVEIRESVVPWL